MLTGSADGHYELKLNTKAIVHYNGLVAWQPPATYKSACDIDVEYFPLDIQTCFLKLGSWTYAGYQVRHQILLVPLLCLFLYKSRGTTTTPQSSIPFSSPFSLRCAINHLTNR